MKAIGKYLIVKPLVEETVKTETGLLLSSEQKQKVRYKKGIIHRVGSDVGNILKENDEIRYDSINGFDMLLEGELYSIIKEHDVIVVF
jgi:co-chaperonin GroES (HSP10)